MTHRLSGTTNTSSSPDFPVSSSQQWLTNKRRSHSFTSGFSVSQWHKMILLWICERCLMSLNAHLTICSQQPFRRSNPYHTHLGAEAWKEGPTTVWPLWLETSHQTVQLEAEAPTPRCWPQLDGSRTSTRTLLWGATPACQGLATSLSSKSSSGKGTSEF